MISKISELRNTIDISEFSKVYNFSTVEFTFNIINIVANKLEVTNTNRILDLQNKKELIFNTGKYGIPSLCSVTSGKLRDKDEVVRLMKRDSEFMTLLLYYISLLNDTYNPRSINISKIIGNEKYNSYYRRYLLKKDIEIDWYYVMPDNCDLINDKDKLLITIF